MKNKSTMPAMVFCCGNMFPFGEKCPSCGTTYGSQEQTHGTRLPSYYKIPREPKEFRKRQERERPATEYLPLRKVLINFLTLIFITFCVVTIILVIGAIT